MGMKLSSALVLVSLVGMAQEPAVKAESGCYKDKSVDEYIVELNKRQKGSRNPLPNDICIFGMCTHTGVGPKGKQPDPPPPDTSTTKPELKRRPEAGEANESTSKKQTAEVAGTLPAEASSYDPVSAARNVDVGDYYFRQKSYRGALNRYADAAKAKPGDAAIYLRMGRGWEKLGNPERAYLHYDAVLQLEPEGKSAAEAREAMARLKPVLEKAGVDPTELAAGEHPEKAPCLAAPAGSR